MQRHLTTCALAGAILLGGLLWSRGDSSAPPAPAPAAPKKEPHVLRTSGTATVRLKPDAARVFFGVQTQAATVKEARIENNQRVRKIMTALTALKITDLKTKTSDVQVDIVYARHDGVQLPVISGYRVTNTFTVLVQDKDPVQLGVQSGRVLDAALEAGANSVQQVTFLSKDGMTEARRKALTQAVEDALANARAMAAGANKGPVEAFNIDGQPVYRDRFYGRNQMAQVSNVAVPDGGGDDGTLVIGDLEVTCQVNVACNF